MDGSVSPVVVGAMIRRLLWTWRDERRRLRGGPLSQHQEPSCVLRVIVLQLESCSHSTTTAIFSRESGELVVRAKCSESMRRLDRGGRLLDPGMIEEQW